MSGRTSTEARTVADCPSFLVCFGCKKRIFGLSSAPESPRFDVRENISDDLPKVGSAQGAMLQVLAVSPAAQSGQKHRIVSQLLTFLIQILDEKVQQLM